MRCRAIVWLSGLLLVLTAGARTSGTAAASVVDLKLSGAYFSEPATLQITVTVEPNDANRALWIAAESEGMYRASEIPLSGANERRQHLIMFKNLTAGRYSVSAQVRSATGVRGMATRELEVIGMQ